MTAYLLSVPLALHLASVPTVHGMNVVAGRFCPTITENEILFNAISNQNDKVDLVGLFEPTISAGIVVDRAALQQLSSFCYWLES